MGFVHDCEYEENQTFDTDVLLAVTPEDVYHYLCLQAFGKTHPTAEDNPKLCRQSPLEYSKKAISYFMPNKSAMWDVRREEGNPPKSKVVNDVIDHVGEKQVKKLGAEPKHVRPLTIPEFDQVINMMCGFDKSITKYSIYSFLIFQYNLIARIDDVAHVYMNMLKPHYEHSFALIVELCWSKNVNEERDAPDQILLGENDPNFCVLLALAIHLETWPGYNDGESDKYLFGMYDLPVCTKERVGRFLREDVFTNELFVPSHPGHLGTHSIRKLQLHILQRIAVVQQIFPYVDVGMLMVGDRFICTLIPHYRTLMQRLQGYFVMVVL